MRSAKCIRGVAGNDSVRTVIVNLRPERSSILTFRDTGVQIGVKLGFFLLPLEVDSAH
jgi:hypothetical protein